MASMSRSTRQAACRPRICCGFGQAWRGVCRCGGECRWRHGGCPCRRRDNRDVAQRTRNRRDAGESQFARSDDYRRPRRSDRIGGRQTERPRRSRETHPGLGGIPLAAVARQCRDHVGSFRQNNLPPSPNCRSTATRPAERMATIPIRSGNCSRGISTTGAVREGNSSNPRTSARVFIEVGPGKVLTDLVNRILKDEPVAAFPLDAPGRDGWTQLGHLLARAASLGLGVQTAVWYAGRGIAPQTLAEFFQQAKPRPGQSRRTGFSVQPRPFRLPPWRPGSRQAIVDCEQSLV